LCPSEAEARPLACHGIATVIAGKNTAAAARAFPALFIRHRRRYHERGDNLSQGELSVPAITLNYGADDPLLLKVADEALIADCRGPEGVVGAAARQLVAAAVGGPAEGPALELHVVPGDRVAIALSGDVPQVTEVVAAVVERLVGAGVEPGDIALLHAPALEALTGSATRLPVTAPGGSTVTEFDPADEPQAAYMAADSADRPIHLARALVDADVVASIGGWSFDAAFAGRSIEGDLWPTFSRRSCRQDLVRAFAKRGRRALDDWKTSNQEATWQLGLCASLRLVGGRGDTLAAAAFGFPPAAARQARALAAGWRPRVRAPAALSIASLSDPRGGLAMLLRAVAAAARVTHPAGTVCIASRLTERPGVIFTRWREGASLEGLVREAVGVADQSLIVDAFQTRLFAKALGDRRLVLLSDLDEDLVEELELGFAGKPEVVERLAHKADSVAVLHEADRMLPRLA